MVAKNLKRITVYVQPDTYDKIEKMAELDQRTLSQKTSRLLDESVAIDSKLRGDLELLAKRESTPLPDYIAAILQKHVDEIVKPDN